MFISGVKGDPGWEENKDGELVAGFTFKKGNQVMYIVRPDDFSAAADDCVLRPHWRLAYCTTKYGNVSK